MVSNTGHQRNSRRNRLRQRRHLFGGILLLALLFGGTCITETVALLLMVIVTWLAMVSVSGLRKAVAISLAGFIIPLSIFWFRHWETFHGENDGMRPALEISMELTVLCSMVYGAVVWVQTILKSRRAGFDEVIGACNLYMWIATIFACFYTLISKITPGAFHFQYLEGKGFGLEDMRQKFDQLYYFSFVTQTTLGYGDIVPVSHFARALAVTQAIIGQFYVAVVLTYILNLWIQDLGRHVDKKEEPILRPDVDSHLNEENHGSDLSNR